MLTLPNTFCKSDSCYLAMGGYSSEGVVWRYWIPVHLQFQVSINILEFIALRITVWMSLRAIGLEKGEGNGTKIMAHMDSTSALRWFYHQTFYDGWSELKEEIARAFGMDLMKVDAPHYSQHIPGVDNIIADILSHSNLPATDLIKFLQEHHADKLSENFRIVELPEEIIFWIQSTLQKGTPMKELQKQHKMHKRKCSINGPNSPLDANWTYSSGVVEQREKTRSLVASRSVSDIMNLAKRMQVNVKDKQFQPPSTMWQRPSNRKIMQTHDKSAQEK